MNSRYLLAPETLCNSGYGVLYSGEGNIAPNLHISPPQNSPPPPPPPPFLIRLSRAKWYSFLRRVFHYQNGSGSDLGPNPFNSRNWMLMEFITLAIQISAIAYTLIMSKQDRLVWPMRIWISGYAFGCFLTLILLYCRYTLVYLTPGDNTTVSDIEQQRSHQESRLLGYNLNKASLDRGATEEQIAGLQSWKYKDVENSPKNNEIQECCICLAKYKDKEEIRKLPWDREIKVKMMDYNVPGGKLNRGISVVDSYKLLKLGKELTDDEVFLACSLGWCIEWLQAYFLVLDDIMDGSHTRRGQPCWFRLPKVGMIAVNDGIILRNHISRILKKHFKGKPYYVDLVDLFNEVEFQTAHGQMIDLITTLVGEKDLSKYSMPLHHRIVKYKTGYYSFYLPVACALLIFGENLDQHVNVKDILVDMGTYFQVQDDYLDCFGDPEVIGKIGTDIEDFKCSWLVVKALELCNEDQKKSLYENYGKDDPVCVAKVKDIYKALKLQDVYLEYESKIYEKIINSIEAVPRKEVQAVLKSFLAKIYKRQK
ncbi:hypothetical protein RD792_002573 [Penstemon davidsonii]|uniref:Uncharacterized protein n=1 Tax=Penstemon davidsonii TaxID=160366 RepID=A0ABR0DRD1_9LAMI|nr:hypothetical protein RD792_002569 [Penstemon davidsonii]KAK4491797.1 hypothetical protein RD792_002573 [Penstemon davidsonii]